VSKPAKGVNGVAEPYQRNARSAPDAEFSCALRT